MTAGMSTSNHARAFCIMQCPMRVGGGSPSENGPAFTRRGLVRYSTCSDSMVNDGLKCIDIQIENAKRERRGVIGG